jgi:hypothetical protein
VILVCLPQWVVIHPIGRLCTANMNRIAARILVLTLAACVTVADAGTVDETIEGTGPRRRDRSDAGSS